jgi:tetratricopeptide (TPR) repeat protein
MISGALSSVLVLALLGAIPVASGQGVQPTINPAVVEVRQTLDAARKEIDAYRAGGGQAGAPDHPAVKWQATLWEYRQRDPGSEAAARATAEAIQFLVRAELWEQAHARIDSLPSEDLAWERLAAYLYVEGSLRKDFGYAVAKLSEVAAGSPHASIKSAALLALGRAQRRQGDLAAAVRTLESARDTAAESAWAQEAAGILYEIANLSVGLVAPSFSGKSRAGRAIDLTALRGSAVVMVFWAST